jgi:hypothetical protein
MPSTSDREIARARLPIPRAACAALSIALAILVGCDQQAEDEPRGGGYVEPTAENQDADGLPKPEARSARGQAKERAEKLVNEDVAEYNKKIEKAAEGTYP